MRYTYRATLLTVLLMTGLSYTPHLSAQPDNAHQGCFLTISDIHLNTDDHSHGEIGTDESTQLWDAAKAEIRQQLKGSIDHSKPGFIIFTGDMPRHGDAATRRADIPAVLRDLREISDQYHIPIILVPGNNDAIGEDYGLFSPAETYNTDDNGWDKGFYPVPGGYDNQRIKAYDVNGWYTYTPIPGLQVIVMNTVIFGRRGSRGNAKVIQDEMDWLGKTLAAAKGQVIIAMHVSPGRSGHGNDLLWTPDAKDKNGVWVQTAFLNLLAQYKDKVVGVVSGHSHMDGIRKLYDSTGHSGAILVSVPGLSADHYNNPAMKVICYDAKTFRWNDFITYYDSTFTMPGTSPQWSSFSFSREFQSGGADMQDYIYKMDPEKLKQDVWNIYGTKGPWKQAENKPEETIDVRP